MLKRRATYEDIIATLVDKAGSCRFLVVVEKKAKRKKKFSLFYCSSLPPPRNRDISLRPQRQHPP